MPATTPGRRKPHRRNEDLEDLLEELSALLEPAEQLALHRLPGLPPPPPVFIVGCGRSGTTLLLQWLAGTGSFGYPTNLLSRFYAAPYVGYRIQELLTDPKYNFNDELLELCGDHTFDSRLGKTRGPLEPNEFWYFWRRHFVFPDVNPLTEQHIARSAPQDFKLELNALAVASDKPFALKAMIFSWNLQQLDTLFERALFLFVHREPLYNAQSLVEARIDFFGDRSAWYAFKPPEYEWLRHRPVAEQVAGQVLFTNSAIRAQLERMAPERYVELTYDHLCARPEEVFHEIGDCLRRQGYDVKPTYRGPKHFKSRRQWRLGDGWREEIEWALDHFEGCMTS